MARTASAFGHGDLRARAKVSQDDPQEVQELAIAFNNMAASLEKSEYQRKEFVANVSHELKTPLASIKLLSDSILQNDMDVDTVREFVSDIGDEADRLTRMSEKLLSLTRFHPDEGSDCEITYFRPTIERVRRMLSTIADMACVELRTEIITDSSILIMEDDLYQICFNLIENAADTLDKVADARGVSRAMKITLLSELILAMVEEVNAIAKELEELRKFKEEHSDDKRNEVPAES